MHTVKLFPGDSAIVGDAEITVDVPVTLTCDEDIERIPHPGLEDLPETSLRVPDLWPHRGHRVPMEFRQDLRCPCGSAYVRKSDTHHSCPRCRRVWENADVPSPRRRRICPTIALRIAHDNGFRPDSYFGPRPLEDYLRSHTKNAELRRLIDQVGESDDVDVQDIADIDPGFLEKIHPAFMGGNYLPDEQPGEVEIARIELASTTHDVTCVYARQVGGVIHYRIVDEYDGETLDPELSLTRESGEPMAQGELVDWFIAVTGLFITIDCNFEDDWREGLGFFVASSDFYPDIDRLCSERVERHFREQDG